MAAVLIRKLSEETHKALKRRAKAHGRSTEAEIRDILEKVLKPEDSENIGEALVALGRRFGGIELDIARDKTSPRDIDFE